MKNVVKICVSTWSIFAGPVTFPKISMTCPILVYLIVGIYSHSYGVCIQAFMAVNGKEFCQMSNKW